MSDPRRLFFALWPDDEVRIALSRWQARYLPAGARHQHVADLHMTLHFVGDVDAKRVEALQVLGDDCGGAAFSLSLDELGCWPGPRVAWGAPSAPPAALFDLYGCLGDGLEGHGFSVEARTYRPHVTLARNVRSAPLHSLSPVRWRVSKMALAASRPDAAPRYEVLNQWRLD